MGESGRLTLSNAPGTGQRDARRLPLDALRGLLVALMALDHANQFVAQKHPIPEMWEGPFPTYTDPIAFLARLTTHLSAPGFFFLMGVGMSLLAADRWKRGWCDRDVRNFFLARGSVLIALKFLVVNRAWELSPGVWGIEVYLGVLFALGATMMLGSFLVGWKPRSLLILAAVLFFGTELLVPGLSGWGTILGAGPFVPVIRALWESGGVPELSMWSAYPILPWFELVVFGLAFGRGLVMDEPRAYRDALILGLAFLPVFAILRMLGGFGNIRPSQGSAWIDFLNVVKYPPSMTFTMLTMGVDLIVLQAFSRIDHAMRFPLDALAVFGRAPLFFYILHLFLYAWIGRLFTPNGTGIPAMIPFWLLGLLILHPCCGWFGRLTRGQPANSILRFF